MGNRLVLWSGGGRFVASKDVASAVIVSLSGGIKVNWGGNGDAEIIKGETWTISNNATNTITWEDVFSISRGTVACAGGYLVSTSAQLPVGHAVWRVRYRLTGGDLFSSSQNAPKYQSQFGRPHNGACPTPTATTYINTVWRVTESGIRTAIVQTPGATTQAQMWIQARFLSAWTKVTSNLGDISIRETLASPDVSLISKGCAIAITYTDNSTQEIPLNYCPTWVKVEKENTCPPETCHQCDHGNEVCCYGKKADGLIYLIDRFHKTS